MEDQKKCCVIGYPAKHSLSPLIHNYWISKYSIHATYEKHEVKPDLLESHIDKLIRQGYLGFNVTIPHKESLLALCDEVDEEARAIGAVNTVAIKDGKLYGHNTDIFGFIQSIKAQHKNFEFEKKPAFLLGAGGAARAILHGLLQEGCPKILIANRTIEKAKKLAQTSADPGRVAVIDWQKKESSLLACGLLVNATSLGMENMPALHISLDQLREPALVLDIVYKPLKTKLLVQAEKRGLRTVNGLAMLLQQARPAFKKWFGRMPEITEELEELILS